MIMDAGTKCCAKITGTTWTAHTCSVKISCVKIVFILLRELGLMAICRKESITISYMRGPTLNVVERIWEKKPTSNNK